jgi:hypothetical protein
VAHQLIFGKRCIAWSDLRPSKLFGESYKDVIPLERLSWLPLNAACVRTFPVPGNTDGSNVEAIETTEQGLLLPPGEHYLISSRGCFKILVLESDVGRFEASLAIGRFVARNSVHSCLDHWRAAPRERNFPLNLQPLRQKFYYSDQPLGLECGELADFLAGEILLYGGQARRVWVMDPEKKAGHIVVEVFEEETAKWVMVDPDFGVVLADADGRLLSVQEISNRSRDGSLHSVTIDNIGNKYGIRPEFYFGPDFVGDCAWTPRMCGDVSLADRQHYLSQVVGRYFKSVQYYTYDVSADSVLTYRAAL